jgi:hypothetical protein
VALRVANAAGACNGDLWLEVRRIEGEAVRDAVLFADEDGGPLRCPAAALQALPAGDYLVTLGAHPIESLGAGVNRLHVEVR